MSPFPRGGAVRSAAWWLPLALVLLLLQQPVSADGWHNAALATSSLDQWLNQSLAGLQAAAPNVKEQIGGANELKSGRNIDDLKNRAKGSKPAAAAGKKPVMKGGKIQGQLTPQQQALLGQKARECMEILACMDPQNIFPAEFPTFQLQQIPNYRNAAKQMLRLMGPSGGSAISNQLRSELMGMSPARGLIPHRDYYQELLDLLKDHAIEGNLTEQDLNDLLQAASGQKNGPQAALAEEIQKAIAQLKDVDIPVLLEWAAGADDAKRKQQFYAKVKSKLGEASVADLLAVKESDADSSTKQAAGRELAKRWNTAGPLELLQALASVDDAEVRRTAAAFLAQSSPKYAEVKEDLGEIWKFASSDDSALANGAHNQMVNAFLRAPISECLEWIAKGDENLEKLIWEQLDDRISRADAERRAGYRDVALAVLANRDAELESRKAAVDLLARLKDRQAVGPVIELLLPLPQDLRPRAGKLLRDLTHQNFGPLAGDGTAEVSVAVKKWREWWKENGGQ